MAIQFSALTITESRLLVATVFLYRLIIYLLQNTVSDNKLDTDYFLLNIDINFTITYLVKYLCY